MQDKKPQNRTGFLDALLGEKQPGLLDDLLAPAAAQRRGRTRHAKVECHLCGTVFPVNANCPGCGAPGEETAQRQ